MSNMKRQLKLFCIFPGLIDVVILVTLYFLQRRLSLDGQVIGWWVFVVGFLRYLLHLYVVGWVSYSSRNWYIKQSVFIGVATSLLFLYGQATFTWVFAAYNAELVFLEVIIAIYKEVVRR